jgi:anti-sigma B factor antagonist
MWLTCSLSWDGKATIVHARGEIDAFTSTSLGESLRAAMMENRGQIMVDLSEVTFIDGSGLRILERCQQDCRDRGLSFGLTKPAPHIRRLLQLVDLDKVLPILDSISGEHDDAPVHGRSDPW